MKSNHEPKLILWERQNKSVAYRPLLEIVIIFVLTFTAQFLWKDFRILFAILPTAYFFIERHKRRRTWAEIGFKVRAIPRDISTNLFLILLVSVFIQFIVVWIAKTWIPAFIDHVIARTPISLDQTAKYIPVLIVGALWEEINFRALYQERLSWFIPQPIAIFIVSVLFGIGHWAKGDPVLVMVDVLLVIVDSILYGIIFARSKNIFVTWIAHFLANLFAIGFVLLQ